MQGILLHKNNYLLFYDKYLLTFIFCCAIVCLKNTTAGDYIPAESHVIRKQKG